MPYEMSITTEMFGVRVCIHVLLGKEASIPWTTLAQTQRMWVNPGKEQKNMISITTLRMNNNGTIHSALYMLSVYRLLWSFQVTWALWDPTSTSLCIFFLAVCDIQRIDLDPELKVKTIWDLVGLSVLFVKHCINRVGRLRS